MRRQRPVVKDGLNSLPMKNKTAPSIVPTSPAAVVSGFTLGLDLHERGNEPDAGANAGRHQARNGGD